MKRLHLIYTALVIAAMVLVLDKSGAQPEPLKSFDPSTVQPQSTNGLLWFLVLSMLAILGWMIKTWYMDLREWKRELVEQVSDHGTRIVELETKCDMNHDPERHNGSHHKEYAR